MTGKASLLLPALLLAAACGPVDTGPFTPDMSGNYSFQMQYTGNCASSARPGFCSVSPVVVLQEDQDMFVQPLGAGTAEELIVVFASDDLALCDLTEATLAFAGVFDGADIAGQFTGTMQRTGFPSECTVQNGTFSMTRLP